MLRNAIARRNVRMPPVTYRILVDVASPIIGTIAEDDTTDKRAKASMNFGNLYQTSTSLGMHA